MKKRLFVFLLTLLGVSVWAYDGTVLLSHFGGYYSRQDFFNFNLNSDMASEVLHDIGIYYNELWELTADSIDQESSLFLNDLVSYIYGNYTVENRDTYIHVVQRGRMGTRIDGWIVMSNYTDAAGWFHYIWYFW